VRINTRSLEIVRSIVVYFIFFSEGLNLLFHVPLLGSGEVGRGSLWTQPNKEIIIIKIKELEFQNLRRKKLRKDYGFTVSFHKTQLGNEPSELDFVKTLIKTRVMSQC